MGLKRYFGLDDKDFSRTLWRLALPIMLQQLVASSVTLVDNIMIGGLGDNALAALMQANQVSFLMMVFMFGISSATQAFTAQYWGRRDLASIRRTQGLAMVAGQTMGWLFLLAAMTAPHFILSLFTKEAEVIALGVDYLRIIAFTYPMVGLNYVLAAVLRGTENVRLPMCTSIAGLLCNCVLNYALIYGHFGLPAMGVKGAALASAIAVALDMMLMLTFSKVLKKPTAMREYPLFAFDRGFIKRFGAVAIPVFLNESLWSLGQSMLVLLYSWLGTQMAAGMSVFNSLDRLGFIAYVGIGNACAVMCGKCIGAGEEPTAQRYAQRFVRLSPLIGLCAGLLLNAVMPFVLGFYSLSALSHRVVMTATHLYLLGAPLMATNYVIVVGVLRSGGDARYSLALDAGLQWLLMVGGVALGAYWIGVPLWWVYAFILPGELVKMVLGRKRVLSRRWIHNLTH